MDLAIIQSLRARPLSGSVRKFVRREKGRIRKLYFTLAEQEAKIEEMYRKVVRKPAKLPSK